MANQEECRIPKLRADNYVSWSARIKGALDQRVLWDAIDPGFGAVIGADDRKRDKKAKNFIMLMVTDKYIRVIRVCNRAKDACRILQEAQTNHGLLP